MIDRRAARAATSYVRSFAAAALAVWVAGNFEAGWREMAAAGVAAILPPLLRWLNPGDMAFGRGSAGAA
jgi:hypothetical protein